MPGWEISPVRGAAKVPEIQTRWGCTEYWPQFQFREWRFGLAAMKVESGNRSKDIEGGRVHQDDRSDWFNESAFRGGGVFRYSRHQHDLHDR